MSKLKFIPFQLPEETGKLIQFLTANPWPFHVNSILTVARVESMISAGSFDGQNHSSFWIESEGQRTVGLIRILDLDDIDDGYPLFDLRLLTQFQGLGYGRESVTWLIKMLFEKFPQLEKIAGTTRADNLAMRQIFRSCLFAKEGHYRNDWASSDGTSFDTVKYSILRTDWETGVLTPVLWNDEIKAPQSPRRLCRSRG